MVSKALALVSITIFGAAVAAGGCSSSSSGTGGTGDDTTPDAAVGGQDAKADHVTTMDAQTFDTGPTGEAAATCAPAGVTGFTAPAYEPAGSTPGACAAADIQGFYDGCLGMNQSDAACGNYQAGSTTGTTAQQMCGACLNGGSAADGGGTLFGALIAYFPNFAQLDSVNIPGCIQIADPSTTGLACATAWQQAEVCIGYDCMNCSMTDDSTGNATNACAMSSQTGHCASYFTALENACTDIDDGGAGSPCVTGTDFESDFIAVGTVLCGAH